MNIITTQAAFHNYNLRGGLTGSRDCSDNILEINLLRCGPDCYVPSRSQSFSKKMATKSLIDFLTLHITKFQVDHH